MMHPSPFSQENTLPMWPNNIQDRIEHACFSSKKKKKELNMHVLGSLE